MKHQKAWLKRAQPRPILVLMLAGAIIAATTAVVVSVFSPNRASATQRSFTAVGNNQPFNVPAGVNQLSVIVTGAGGGAGGAATGIGSGVTANGGSAGGGAALGTTATPRTIPVTPGDTLLVNVGGQGEAGGSGAAGGTSGSSFKAAGGGGAGGASGSVTAGRGGGGGGASSIVSQTTNAVLIVAGGGGGGGGGGTVTPAVTTNLSGGNAGTAGGTGSTAPTAGQHPSPTPAQSSGAGSNCASTTAGACSTIGGGGTGTPLSGCSVPTGAPANSCSVGAGGGGGGTGAGYNGVVNADGSIQGNGQGGGAGLGGLSGSTAYGAGGGGGGGGASWLVNAAGVGVLATPNSFTNAGNGSVTITYFQTQTTLSSSAAQAAPGVPVTLTATVSVAETGFTLPNNSTVTFFSDGTAIAGCGAVSIGSTGSTTSRTVTCSANTAANQLPAGARTITAVYNGSASTSPAVAGNIAGSTSDPVPLLIGPSTTTLASTPNPSDLGQSVTLTATVTPQGASSFTPTGTVTFLDGGTPIPGCETVALSGTTATCNAAFSTGGTHTLTAVYSGDSHFGPSTSAPLQQTVRAITGTIFNTANGVQAGSVGLTETHGVDSCSALADGLWHPCATINKYGGGTLTSGASVSTNVTLQNIGSVPAQLFLLPSACADSVTGAGGTFCGLVSVEVSCGVTPAFHLGPETLNAFHAARNYPTGIAVGTVPAGTSVSCTFKVTAATITAPGGNLSQPIAWRLQAS